MNINLYSFIHFQSTYSFGTTLVDLCELPTLITGKFTQKNFFSCEDQIQLALAVLSNYFCSLLFGLVSTLVVISVIYQCNTVCYCTAVKARIHCHGYLIDMACPAGNVLKLLTA